jgi:hypothetical protein
MRVIVFVCLTLSLSVISSHAQPGNIILLQNGDTLNAEKKAEKNWTRYKTDGFINFEKVRMVFTDQPNIVFDTLELSFGYGSCMMYGCYRLISMGTGKTADGLRYYDLSLAKFAEMEMKRIAGSRRLDEGESRLMATLRMKDTKDDTSHEIVLWFPWLVADRR